MKTLQINHELNNLEDEYFRIDIDNMIVDDSIYPFNNLSIGDKNIYNDFIELIGLNNVIISDVNIDEEMINFSRLFRFDYDDNYNIIGLGTYIKSYNEYTTNEQQIIDSFLNFISSF